MKEATKAQNLSDAFPTDSLRCGETVNNKGIKNIISSVLRLLHSNVCIIQESTYTVII
jgi:hypothetical protein